jgi:hypothetical protein
LVIDHSKEIMMKLGAIVSAFGMAIATPSFAEPTRVVVRVLSQDGKFVGDHTGGARVTLRDAKSRKILAQGITKGGTGDTNRIMRANGRSPLLQTDGAATFDTVVDIAEPTLVDLEVTGPLGRPGSLIHVRSQRWMVPGQAIDIGNGWMVELPGLAITPTASRNGSALVVRAKVELMCGCPITPGGEWDASEYAVTAIVWSGGKKLATIPLPFIESPGVFSGSVNIPPSNETQIYVKAINTKTGNSGLVSIPN